MDRIGTTTAALLATIGAVCCGTEDGAGAFPRPVPAVPSAEAPEGAPVLDASPDPRTYRDRGPRPPPMPAEDRGAAPDEEHAFARGHHVWTGREHVWVPGVSYALRKGQVYEPSHWAEWRRGWYFVPGYWRRR